MKELLQRYIKGEVSEKERLKIASWLDESPENMREFLVLRKLYDISLWQANTDKTNSVKKVHYSIRKIMAEILKIAAIFLIGFWGSKQLQIQQSNKKQMQTIHVPAGQRAEVTLADGTHVWLNSRSTLKFPEQFSANTRNVELDGEGYFSVQHNENSPMQEVGHPISSFYGYVIDGIFQTQGEVDSHVEQSDKAIGRWKYRDVNNDGKIDSQDRAYIGNPHPDFEYSLSSRFYYKNFDLSLYIQGSQGNDICFASKGGRDGLDFWGDYFNKSTRILNTWTPENRNAELPEINILNPNDEAGKVSSYLIEDGSYIRLKQLELGYTLPKQTLSKIGLQQCRVYLNAENLLTLTKYNNIDPEVKNGDDKNMGVDYMNNMPLARVFSIGFNLSF